MDRMTFLSVCLIFLFLNMKDSTVACLQSYTVKVLMFLLNNINGKQSMNVTYNNMNGINLMWFWLCTVVNMWKKNANWMQQMIFIADLIACSACFGHDYAHHQELESIIQVVAVCVVWCFGFQVVGMVMSWGLCVRFAGYIYIYIYIIYL